MGRRKKTRSVVMIGRVWAGRDGAECTTSIYVNGEHVKHLEVERGSNDYCFQRGQEWLFENGYFPGMERSKWGGLEVLWQYAAREGVSVIKECANVERMKDL